MRSNAGVAKETKGRRLELRADLCLLVSHFGWLVGWLGGWLVGCLVGWVVGWPELIYVQIR
jgi:hypothetical protein